MFGHTELKKKISIFKFDCAQIKNIFLELSKIGKVSRWFLGMRYQVP